MNFTNLNSRVKSALKISQKDTDIGNIILPINSRIYRLKIDFFKFLRGQNRRSGMNITSFLPLVITQRGDSGADGKMPNGWPEYITSV